MAAPTFALFHPGDCKLADESCELVCSCDPDGNIIEANESMQRITGYSREEALQMNLSTLVGESWKLPPTGSEGLVEITAVAKDGQAVRLRMTRRGAHLESTAVAPAQHDSLTGLPNRACLIEVLAAAVKQSQPSRRPALLLISLDRFRHVNDTLGHATGDRLLQIVGERLTRALGEDDVAGRMGGDEFAVILDHPADEREAVRTAHEMLNVLRAPYQIGGDDLFVTASIGAAIFPSHGGSANELLRTADMAMRHAKSGGKNAVEVFSAERHAPDLERLRLGNALHGALEHKEFALVYEPVINAKGQLESLEALLTWRHPVHGPVPATQFIPIAEETGLIFEIGYWVLQQACLDAAGWRAAGLRMAPVCVNVSALQFERGDFAETVAAALKASGLPARYLQLELTESCVMRQPAEAALRMAEIRKLGVSIAIDDFGTGYSSLSYLSKFPVDALKIDQSFLRGSQETRGSLPVIQSIVRLAHSLNLAVVAEGVETREELELVRLLGCDMAQGRVHGPRLDRDAVEALLGSDADGQQRSHLLELG